MQVMLACVWGQVHRLLLQGAAQSGQVSALPELLFKT